MTTIPLDAVARLVRSARASPDDELSKDILLVIGAMWEAMGVGAFVVGAPHANPADCPSYYDGCNCTVGNLDDQIKYAEELLNRVDKLKEERDEFAAALRYVHSQWLIDSAVGSSSRTAKAFVSQDEVICKTFLGEDK